MTRRFSLLLIFLVVSVLPVANLSAQAPVDPTRILTIDDAVKVALEQNLDIALSHSRVESASAQVTSAFGNFLPTIGVTGGYTHPLTSGTLYYEGTPIGGDIERPDNLSANASASVQLFDGFSRTATYRAAQSSFNASVEDLNQARQDIAYQTRASFLNLLRSQQLIEVQQSNLEVAQAQLDRTRGLVQAGTAQEGDVYAGEANIANVELSLEQSRTDALVAANTLAALLNVDPAVGVHVSAEGLANSLDSTEMSNTRRKYGVSSQAYQQQIADRPDIQAARLRVDVADAEVTQAKAGYYPTLGASLGWGWDRSGATTIQPSNSSSNAQFGLNFSYNLFDGFRTNQQVAVAQANKLTAEVAYRRLLNQAKADLQGSLARLDGAERQVRAADRAVAAARQSRYAAEERYKVGVGTNTDFLLASSQLLQAQINQVNAVFSYRLALYEVMYRLGK